MHNPNLPDQWVKSLMPPKLDPEVATSVGLDAARNFTPKNCTFTLGQLMDRCYKASTDSTMMMTLALNRLVTLVMLSDGNYDCSKGIADCIRLLCNPQPIINVGMRAGFKEFYQKDVYTPLPEESMEGLAQYIRDAIHKNRYQHPPVAHHSRR